MFNTCFIILLFLLLLLLFFWPSNGDVDGHRLNTSSGGSGYVVHHILEQTFKEAAFRPDTVVVVVVLSLMFRRFRESRRRRNVNRPTCLYILVFFSFSPISHILVCLSVFFCLFLIYLFIFLRRGGKKCRFFPVSLLLLRVQGHVVLFFVFFLNLSSSFVIIRRLEHKLFTDGLGFFVHFLSSIFHLVFFVSSSSSPSFALCVFMTRILSVCFTRTGSTYTYIIMCTYMHIPAGLLYATTVLPLYSVALTW